MSLIDNEAQGKDPYADQKYCPQGFMFSKKIYFWKIFFRIKASDDDDDAEESGIFDSDMTRSYVPADRNNLHKFRICSPMISNFGTGTRSAHTLSIMKIILCMIKIHILNDRNVRSRRTCDTRCSGINLLVLFHSTPTLFLRSSET